MARLTALLLSVTLLAGCFVPVAKLTSKLVEIGNSDGGFVDPVYEHIEKMRATGQKAVLRQRYCWSACTMYLAVAECVGATTEFGFHGGTRWFVLPFPELTVALADYYPGELRDWFLNTSASNYNPIGLSDTLSGAKVSKKTGIPICPPDIAARG